MPYVNIRVIKGDELTLTKKQQVIAGVTEVLQRVLDKDPAHTFIVIDEVDANNWGVNSQTVASLRESEAQKPD